MTIFNKASYRDGEVHFDLKSGEHLTLPLETLKNVQGFGSPEVIAKFVDHILNTKDVQMKHYCGIFDFEPDCAAFEEEMFDVWVRSNQHQFDTRWPDPEAL